MERNILTKRRSRKLESGITEIFGDGVIPGELSPILSFQPTTTGSRELPHSYVNRDGSALAGIDSFRIERLESLEPLIVIVSYVSARASVRVSDVITAFGVKLKVDGKTNRDRTEGRYVRFELQTSLVYEDSLRDRAIILRDAAASDELRALGFSPDFESDIERTMGKF